MRNPVRTALTAAALAFSTLAAAGSPGDFDFWLGQWTLSWGSDSTGTNVVTRELGDKVIVERFDGSPSSPLKGMSVSTYDPRSDQWKQTWVDNNGSYLDFTGGLNPDGSMELWRGATDKNGQPILQRMLFYNIRRDSLDWNWERSDDGGRSWTTLWKIHYERADR